MECFQKILQAALFLFILAGCCLLLLILADQSETASLPGSGLADAPVVNGAARTLPEQVQDHQAPSSVSMVHDVPAGIILRELMRRDTSGLEVTTDSSGMQTIILDGRFTHVSAAIRDEQGNLRIQCFTGYPAMQTAMDAKPSAHGTTNEGKQGVAY